MKAFMILKMVSGVPEVDLNLTPCFGYVLAAELPLQWGLYLFSGTPAQLTAIDALPQVTGLCMLTEYKFDQWTELDTVLNATVRTQLNTMLTDHGMPTIPASWTYRQVVNRLMQDYRTGDMRLLEHTLATAFRTALNTMLTNHGVANVPTNWTYFQVMQQVDQRLNVRWPEVGDTVDAAVRTKLNTWLTTRGYPNIPAGWTYRRLLQEVFERMNQPYNLGGVDVAEP